MVEQARACAIQSAKKRKRTVTLITAAIASIKGKEAITIKGVQRATKKVDKEGKGLSLNTIRHNHDCKRAMAKASGQEVARAHRDYPPRLWKLTKAALCDAVLTLEAWGAPKSSAGLADQLAARRAECAAKDGRED